jgi:hypothetical protein
MIDPIIAKTIPYLIKEEYKKRIIEGIEKGIYEEDVEFFKDYGDYFFKPAYKEDFIQFLVDLGKRNDLKPTTKAFLYKELIGREKLEYVRKLIDLPITEEIKTYRLGEALYLFHLAKKAEGFECVNTLSEAKSVYTDSLSTYSDSNHTPDLIFDCNKLTTWRIKNLNDRKEATLHISSYMLDKANYQIKILSGNYESGNSFKNYCRPKKIRITLISEKTKKTINQKEYVLQDIRDFQTIDFKLGVIQSIKNKIRIKRSLLEDSGIYDVYHEMKIEILDYYKGLKPHCDIAELRIIPIE